MQKTEDRKAEWVEKTVGKEEEEVERNGGWLVYVVGGGILEGACSRRELQHHHLVEAMTVDRAGVRIRAIFSRLL